MKFQLNCVRFKKAFKVYLNFLNAIQFHFKWNLDIHFSISSVCMEDKDKDKHKKP